MTAGIVTNEGLANVMAAWAAYASRPLYLQFGTGSGQGVTSNDLAGAVQERVLGSSSVATTSVIGDTLRIDGTVTADTGLSISELGVFDAISGGNMDIYGDFDAITLASGDSIVFQISVVVT